MKSWVWSLGIILLIAVVGIFWSFGISKEDSFSKTPIATSNQVRNNEATKTSMKKTYSQPPPVLTTEQIKGKKARVKTARGDIIFELFTDSPMAASNFIFLSQDGFYDGLTFHRREEGFVIQGGDPNGNGAGGPGYNFADEEVTRDYKRGIVAMANAGPNTNGSQFFIMLADTTTLPKNYTIFGQVVGGMDVVDKIQVGDVMEKITLE